MNKSKKISISVLKIESPKLGTDAEGKLRGGFSVAAFSDTAVIENANCGCTMIQICLVPVNGKNCNVEYTNGNCNCIIKKTTPKPTTTTDSTFGAGQNFSMNLSLLF